MNWTESVTYLSRLLRKLRYGDPVIVISGLPRSGTSMMMQMLAAGGVPVVTDAVRRSDSDNPGGYFEHERVKDLEQEADKGWLRAARGHAIKVISHLLEHLPEENFYKVILMRRDLDEILASQNIMLDHRAESNPVEDDVARELFRKHLVKVKVHMRRKPNFELLELGYRAMLDDPQTGCATVNAFLGGGFDVAAMAQVVDPQLYRNRRTSP